MRGDSLLATKLLAPATRSDRVTRTRLIARLLDAVSSGRQLTLVCAPAGFGKTTLIRDWVGASERSVGWLSLDEGDNDPERFLDYLVAAVHQATSADRMATIARASPDSPKQRLVALINDLTRTETSLILVLDDYHAIRSFEVHDLVAFLLAHQAPRLHLALGTREDPPLPLARLRARDQVTEVRESDLRFTTEEAAAFLTQTMRLPLDAAAISALAARTEGWITGLQLAGLAIRQRAGKTGEAQAASEFVAAFAGDDRYVVDYLMAEVLDRAPPSLRAFLRRTSILDRLCAPLCDALTGREDSQSVLEQLEAANLFLIPLDSRREWYRYHVLFAEVLRLSLNTAEQDEMNRQAARWFQTNGWGEMALHHARSITGAQAGSGGAPRGAAATAPLIEPLSEREIEVLHLIADGCSNAEIGQRLSIAIGTVKRHINNIYGKLGVESRTQAIARGRALGILD
jgi:LuxR family transcriptional regulator, maltose regulon positive regulatory protein